MADGRGQRRAETTGQTSRSTAEGVWPIFLFREQTGGRNQPPPPPKESREEPAVVGVVEGAVAVAEKAVAENIEEVYLRMADGRTALFCRVVSRDKRRQYYRPQKFGKMPRRKGERYDAKKVADWFGRQSRFWKHLDLGGRDVGSSPRKRRRGDGEDDGEGDEEEKEREKEKERAEQQQQQRRRQQQGQRQQQRQSRFGGDRGCGSRDGGNTRVERESCVTDEELLEAVREAERSSAEEEARKERVAWYRSSIADAELLEAVLEAEGCAAEEREEREREPDRSRSGGELSEGGTGLGRSEESNRIAHRPPRADDEKVRARWLAERVRAVRDDDDDDDDDDGTARPADGAAVEPVLRRVDTYPLLRDVTDANLARLLAHGVWYSDVADRTACWRPFVEKEENAFWRRIGVAETAAFWLSLPEAMLS